MAHTGLATEYANLLLMGVPPYGSVYTDDAGELNGEEAQFALATFEEAGFAAGELAEVAGADHLGLGLCFIAECSNARRDYGQFLERFAHWAPVCCAAVEREPGVHPFYGMLAERTRELILREADAVVIPANAGIQRSAYVVPESAETTNPLSDLSGASEDKDLHLSDILAFLLAPARCGFFLSRARLGHIALRMEMRLPFGTRFDVARSLFTAAGESNKVPGLLDALATEIAAAGQDYGAWSAMHSGWRDAAHGWLEKTAGANRWISALRAFHSQSASQLPLFVRG